jgi:hypothetical protein
MIQRASEPPPTPKTEATGLAQQKADFTSEGSPPPGQVGTTVPVTAAAKKPASHHAAATASRARKSTPWGRSR